MRIKGCQIYGPFCVFRVPISSHVAVLEMSDPLVELPRTENVVFGTFKRTPISESPNFSKAATIILNGDF